MNRSRKKLIEVALPLEAINKASAREKSIRHGHPSTLHLWWARRPLAAARAVIFAQMVDDPSASPDLFITENAQEKERQRLFRIIEELVQWENTANELVLEKARAEIWQSWRRACAENVDHPRAKELFNRDKLPAFHDPFAGGGALPLEAQRLGLEAYAGDLNPVAVLINKAMIEIPPMFLERRALNPKSREEETLIARQWNGAQGLAEDVRYYGAWMRNEAAKRISHLYPKIEITAETVRERPDLKPLMGHKLTVIAWLWVRTVKSPNPAFRNVEVPLASTFTLSSRPGREAYVEPVVGDGGYCFRVRVGKGKEAEAAKAGTRLARGAFKCLMSSSPFSYSYIDEEANAGRMGQRLMAIVAESEHGRIYLSPTKDHEDIAASAKPAFRPDAPSRGTWASNAQGRQYGFRTFGDYFTPRQLVTLTTLSGLVGEAISRAREDAIGADIVGDNKSLREGGTGPAAYGDAIGIYLALAVDKAADYNSSLVAWSPTRDQAKSTFARQAIPMVWDYAEVNPLAEAAGDFGVSLEGGVRFLSSATSKIRGYAAQADATTQVESKGKVVSTDPPYYDNIGYADLSDYFYVWLRHSLRPVFPDLFATVAVPKAEELVATLYRHGSKEKAEAFFLNGMTHAMRRLVDQAHPAFPITIYYAFKQSESETEIGTASTGWETFLDAVIKVGFGISGTWPIRTERGSRSISIDTNALASSIVLVCRRRSADAPTGTRREFVSALKSELPHAVAQLQRGNIAPVDLAQAAIGPGMAVYTRYARVMDAAGNPLSVRDALSLINQTLDEVLAEQEGDFDPDTRWAIAWFEQQGFSEGPYGIAETLSKAKNTSVAGMVEANIVSSKRGKVRLLKPEELTGEWDPVTDPRLTAWESVHQLIRAMEAGGENEAASLVAKLGSGAEIARELAYRLYTIAERKKRATEALFYNALVQSWPEIVRLAREKTGTIAPAQSEMFG